MLRLIICHPILIHLPILPLQTNPGICDISFPTTRILLCDFELLILIQLRVREMFTLGEEICEPLRIAESAHGFPRVTAWTVVTNIGKFTQRFLRFNTTLARKIYSLTDENKTLMKYRRTNSSLFDYM